MRCSYKDFAPAELGVVRGIISSTLKQLTGRAETPRDGSQLGALEHNKNKTCQCSDNATLLRPVMASKVYSAAVVGVDAFEVEVEVHTGYGDHGKVAVGRITGYRSSGKQRSGAVSNHQQRSALATRQDHGESGAGYCPQRRA